MDMNVYALLTPAVLALVAAEFLYCLYKKNGYYRFDDSIANLGTAVGNQVCNVFVAWLVFLVYQEVHARWALWDPGEGWASWLALFLGIDFLFYWFHRAGHSINVLWAAHSPHHSSEELNYTVGLRASVTQRFFSFFFYVPLALAYPPERLLPAVGFHLLLQLPPHTRVIGDLGRWYQLVFNSPSHHRIHHAINRGYLDKNFGGALIIWDRLFGTYAEEKEEPVYGVLRPLASWSPVKANLQYWRLLWEDARATPRWADKLKVWFMPTGWRPPSVPPRAPVVFPEPGARRKYATAVTPETRLYLLSQVPVAMAVMLAVTRDDSPLSPAEKTLLGLLTWASVVAWGGLLEGRRWAHALEAARALALAAAAAALGGPAWAAPAAGVTVVTLGLLAHSARIAPWRSWTGRPTAASPG